MLVDGSSSAALTDLFTSSGPLAILSIIADKCRRRHAWEISTEAGLCESIPETPGSRATRKLGSKNDRDSGYFFDRVNAECLEVVPGQKSASGKLPDTYAGFGDIVPRCVHSCAG